MTTETVDEALARRAALSAAAGFPPPYALGLGGAAEFIGRVGYVQIDTISVVARAHEHALWSRAGSFAADPFPALEGRGAEPRRIFEYWAHAAAYLPVDDYRFCLPRMERIRMNGHDWFQVDEKVAAEVLERVRAEGPLSSKDFADPRGKAGSWWDWKPAKRALEYLFQSGRLLVASRKGFAKVFDLPERVLPDALSARPPSAAEAAARFVDRAADAYGIFAADEVAYGRKELTDGVGAELEACVADGRLSALSLRGSDGKTYFARPGTIEAAARSQRERRNPQAFVLSPFDPFVIDRKRMRRLFGFDYALECYVPEAKRRFGYFTLPILAAPDGAGGEGFVGLMDAKADRKAKTLLVRRIALGEAAGCPELRGRGTAETARAVGRALADYARFNGAERIFFERIEAPTASAEAALQEAALQEAALQEAALRGAASLAG